MIRPRHLPLTTFAILLGVTLTLIAGCGSRSSDAPADSYMGHLLDPPDIADGFPEVTEGVPVLCYHYFRAGFNPSYLMKVLGSVIFGMPALGPREFWTTPRGEFEKHLRYFRDTGTVVMTLDEVADAVAEGRDLPSRAVVLTIDDADKSVYELAWPLLRKYGMKAHLFVPTAKVGTSWSELEVCTWEQLTEMEASGNIIVESHTRDLHYKVRAEGRLVPVAYRPGLISEQSRTGDLQDIARYARGPGTSAMPADITPLLAGSLAPIAADLVASRIDLGDGAGAEARWLAWPYGFADGQLDSLSREVGFRGTVSLAPRAFTRQDTTFQVGRFALTAKSTLAHIAGVFPR